MKKTLTILILTIALCKSALASNSDDYPFEVEVSGTGPAVLLIPGLASPGEVWDETVDALKGNYTFHTISLSGMGGTPAIEPSGAYLENAKNGLIKYIRNEKLEQPSIIGHSLGGFLALLLGIEAGDEISKLVIVDSLPFYPAGMNPLATVENSRPIAQQMKSSIINGDPQQAAANQKRVLATMITDPADIETALVWNLQSDPNTVAQAVYELYTIDLRDRIEKITTPTLVLGSWIAYKDFGGTKEITTAIFESQYAKHPNYRLEMSEIGKHFIMFDDPEFFLSQTTAFLDN